MRLKRIAAMLMAAVMAVSLAACGGNTGTNTESSQNPKENAEAQAVHLNLAESWGFEYFYTILTPEVSSSSYDITYYLTSFYDTLFEYNSEGEVVGVLAEDWSMSEDGKTYTFQIKQGVKFFAQRLERVALGLCEVFAVQKRIHTVGQRLDGLAVAALDDLGRVAPDLFV